jgi:hypothetical protein
MFYNLEYGILKHAILDTHKDFVLRDSVIIIRSNPSSVAQRARSAVAVPQCADHDEVMTINQQELSIINLALIAQRITPSNLSD